ncbi:transcriptional regulator ATRX-like [Nilaparvata lugens]|uniref:transcriptional regulator ATRX-like n=1 Tax=Nilaparvata lugens TaxID=108931 RepID=UPI00193C8B48|nr:transcriptional regulator ATRX-like [Nilaparvata lugens]XP_039278561.1 transcriptional regulator ATRX-like [Nilaparvata lugens]
MVNEKVVRNPSQNCVVEVSRDEEKFRKKFPKFEDTKDKQLKCTVCSVNLTPFILAGKSCHLHSFLKVLVCKKCLDFYGDGDFSVDEDGDEKYCRWCGQGGNLFLCEKCNSGFCKACVKRNFNRDVFEELKALDNWDCFMCNPNPLYELRAKAWAAESYYQSHRKEDRKTKMKTNADEDDDAPKEKRAKKDRSANTEPKFIDAGRKLLCDSLDSAKRLAEQCKLQAEKIQKSKLSKKRLKTPEDMRSIETKLQAFLDSFTENVESIKDTLKKSMEGWQQHYDERFKNQTNGDGKSEENGNECDAEEKEGDEDEEKKEKKKKGGEEEQKEGKADDDEEVENEKEDEKNETEEDGKEKEEDGKEKNDEVSSDNDEADGETKKEDKDKEEEEKDEEMETTEVSDAEESKVISDSDANDDSIMDTTAALEETIDLDSEQKKTQD